MRNLRIWHGEDVPVGKWLRSQKCRKNWQDFGGRAGVEVNDIEMPACVFAAVLPRRHMGGQACGRLSVAEN